MPSMVSKPVEFVLESPRLYCTARVFGMGSGTVTGAVRQV